MYERKQNSGEGGREKGREEKREKERGREREREREREKGKEERRGKRKTTPNRRTRINECTDQRHTLDDDLTKTEPVDAPHDCDAHGAPPRGGSGAGTKGGEARTRGSKKRGVHSRTNCSRCPETNECTPNRAQWRATRISSPHVISHFHRKNGNVSPIKTDSVYYSTSQCTYNTR